MNALVAAAESELQASPQAQRLTEEARWTCIVLHKQGKKKAAIAEQLGCRPGTVAAVLARWRATGSPHSGSRAGRPRCTSADEDVNIALTARVQVFTSARHVRRTLFLDTSRQTVHRRLQEAGLFGRVARHKRDYAAAEIRKRLSFANGYGGWSERQWQQVIFADEKCFYGKGFCGRIWVRREKGAALEPQYTIHKQAHPVKVNVWACFSAAGQGYIHIFNENFDGKLFTKIIRKNLAHVADSTLPPGEQRYFLMDNAKTHKGEAAKRELHNASFITLDFPPYSPDLNPIENLWSILARRVEQRTCETAAELRSVIQGEWDKIEPELLHKLAHSMPARCRAVIDAAGWHTKY
jgi:transposase